MMVTNSLSITVAERVTVADVICWAKRAARKAKTKLKKRRVASKPIVKDAKGEDANPIHGPPPTLGISVGDGIQAQDVFGRR